MQRHDFPASHRNASGIVPVRLRWKHYGPGSAVPWILDGGFLHLSPDFAVALELDGGFRAPNLTWQERGCSRSR